MELTTSELFINMKTLPPPGTAEFDDLIEWETEKCLGGININGVRFPGWLYWHLNHWWIFIEGVDKYGNKTRVPSRPLLRDNEWIISEALEACRTHPTGQKGLMIAGARQIGKSEIEASYLAYNAEMFEGGQNVIVGGNDADLSLLKAKFDFGIQRVWEGLRIPKLDRDWRKPMVQMGFKGKDNQDNTWSYVVIRNVNDGKNTEGAAGTTAKSYIGDEVAKYAFAASFEAAKPALIGDEGWRCVPILVCTGGNADKFADAERYFLNPSAQNFLGFIDPITGKETALFLSGEYRKDSKYKTTFLDYLTNVEGRDFTGKDTRELAKLEMLVADKEKARIQIEEERRQKAKDPDQSTYLKQVMYFPLEWKECFMSNSYNYYSTKLTKKQKDKLRNASAFGMFVELEEDEKGKITTVPSAKLPVSGYPTPPGSNLDAPVVIWEHPVPNPPYAMYIAGVDPYKFAQAANSDSLGAVYIFKRLVDVTGESYQDMFVASYVANPRTKEEWNRTAKLLIKYYNARTFVENDEYSFIDYMIAEGEGHMVEDTPEWIAEYAPNSSTIKRPKGVSRANKAIRILLRSQLKEYTEEPFVSILRSETGESLKILGVEKIPDHVLLEELEKWNEDGNFDREVAASLAVTGARKYDSRRIKVNSIDSDPRFARPSLKDNNKNNTLWVRNTHSILKPRKSNLFRR